MHPTKNPQKKNNKWEFPICNNCSNKKFTIIWNDITSWEYAGVFRIVQCVNCALMYVHPRPTANEIGKYYQPESYWGEDVTKGETTANVAHERDTNYGLIYDVILKRKKTGAILDIGAGTGLFLSKFNDLGWQIDGVEFSKDAVTFAKKTFGLHLKTGDFLKHKFKKNTYDVVTLNMALEHLYSPKETLIAINKVMKKDGLLVITVPNLNSLGVKLLKKDWRALDVPRHLYHFTEATAKNMINATGFTVTGTNHWYWVHNYYTVFASFRFKLSPRFKQQAEGGLASQKSDLPGTNPKVSLKKALGKITIKLLSTLIVIAGSLTGKSESIVIYAVKNHTQ